MSIRFLLGSRYRLKYKKRPEETGVSLDIWQIDLSKKDDRIASLLQYLFPAGQYARLITDNLKYLWGRVDRGRW